MKCPVKGQFHKGNKKYKRAMHHLETHNLILNLCPNLNIGRHLEISLAIPSSHYQTMCIIQLLHSIFKVNYLTAQCGYNVADTVRRIMTKLGTNKLWSCYSYKGRKGKKSFKNLNLCCSIISK